MKCSRLAGATLLWAIIGAAANTGVVCAADDVAKQPSHNATLFRVFLKDGSALVSYGELARVGDRVIFSMPTSTSAENPQLHLVDIASDRVDWERTLNYAETARASRYIATRAETDYTMLTTEVAQALNEVSRTSDPSKRLAIVQRARKTLADWPKRHYNYKQADVRQMLTMLDEAIADLRAAIGAQRFDLALVAVSDAPPLVEPLLPAPSAKETIELTLAAATIADSAAARTSLLASAVAALDRDAARIPANWAAATRASAMAGIARELDIDSSYRRLETRILRLADERARAADVRGVQRLMTDLKASDAALGGTRPDTVSATMAAVVEKLDAARRLVLARDRWALRLPELRAYRASITPSVEKLKQLGPALEDIKDLIGSGPQALGSIVQAAADIMKRGAAISAPDEFRDVHGLLMSASQLASSAAALRREAAMTGDMGRAWDASSAAAGALMLSDRLRTEMTLAFRLPQLSR